MMEARSNQSDCYVQSSRRVCYIESRKIEIGFPFGRIIHATGGTQVIDLNGIGCQSIASILIGHIFHSERGLTDDD